MDSSGWAKPGGGADVSPTQHRAPTRLAIGLLASGLVLAVGTVLTTAVPRSLTPDAAAATSNLGPKIVNRHLTRGGQPFLPRGFNMIGLLAPAWCKQGQGPAAWAHFGQAELDAAEAWNANTLRFQVSQRGLADPGVAIADRDAYLAKVVQGVQLARSNGFLVIVSLQDQRNGCGPSHPLPSSMSAAAWQVLAPALMNDSGVMFELFNEPNIDTNAEGWAQWRDGGVGPTTNLGDTPVGHQALVDQVRGLGAKNVLIVDGLDTAERLAGLTPLTDPLGQLMYGVHPYYYQLGVSWWDQMYGTASATYPVIATEWSFTAESCGTKKDTLANTLLAYLRDHGIGVLGHAFDVPGTVITTDWLWTPTDCAGTQGGSGLVTKNFFAGLADPDISVGQVPTPTAMATAPDRVTLQWQVPSGPVAQYDVLRDGAVVATTTDLNYDDANLTADTSYRYQIRAANEIGETGPASDEVSVHTPATADVDAPTAPSLLPVTDLAIDHVGLSWQASTDDVGVVGYDVRRDGVSIGTTDGATRSYVDDTVIAGGSYTYTVAALDAAGNVSDSSADLDVTVPAPDTSPPTAPTGLVANWSPSSGASLAWNADSIDDTGVTGYVVERDGSAIASSTGVTYSDTAPLTPGTHTYAVRATDAAGNVSGPSLSAAVVVPAPPDTSPPTVPTKVSAVVVSPTTSRITWTGSTDNTAVTGYRVTRDGVTVGTVANTVFTDPAMPAGVAHVYRVVALDAAGNASAVSAGASVTAPAAAPNGLTGQYYDTASFSSLKLTRVDPTVNFSWGTSAPAAGMGADTFSVRWAGNVLPLSAETYTFYLQSDEGARLWVNGRLLVDDWTLHTSRERQGTIALTPTRAYSIRVDLRENTKAASVRLSWSTPTVAKSVIPTSQLLSK